MQWFWINRSALSITLGKQVFCYCSALMQSWSWLTSSTICHGRKINRLLLAAVTMINNADNNSNNRLRPTNSHQTGIWRWFTPAASHAVKSPFVCFHPLLLLLLLLHATVAAALNSRWQWRSSTDADRSSADIVDPYVGCKYRCCHPDDKSRCLQSIEVAKAVRRKRHTHAQSHTAALDSSRYAE
jgi:hypothetical protein